jgi:hypothetical protein
MTVSNLRERIVLVRPHPELALVAHPPLGAEAHGDQGRHVERMAQFSWPAFGQAPLVGKAPALMRARLQASVGDQLIYPLKALHVAHLGADSGSLSRAQARYLPLQVLAGRVSAQHLGQGLLMSAICHTARGIVRRS